MQDEVRGMKQTKGTLEVLLGGGLGCLQRQNLQLRSPSNCVLEFTHNDLGGVVVQIVVAAVVADLRVHIFHDNNSIASPQRDGSFPFFGFAGFTDNAFHGLPFLFLKSRSQISGAGSYAVTTMQFS